MKNFNLNCSFIILVTSFIFLSACKKEDAGLVQIEMIKDIYFTINIGTNTYTSYGYRNKKYSLDKAGQYTKMYNIADSGGVSHSELTIEVKKFVKGGIGYAYGLPNYIFLELGDVALDAIISKKDIGHIGTYEVRVGDEYRNIVKVGNEEMYIDKSSLSFNINKELPLTWRTNIVEGNFYCLLFNLQDRNKLIPASGSFRLVNYIF
jgi:hypothetical protein